MGGSVLDQAFEDKRNAELDADLDALMADPTYGTPAPEPVATKAAEMPQPQQEEEEVDLWSEGPDRPQRITKKAGGASAPPSGFWGELKAADQSFRARQAAGEVTPETNPNDAFADGMAGTGGDIVKTLQALGPGWQKLWHDAQAFALENPNSLPRDLQIMSDESEDYFAQFPQPGVGEGPAGLPNQPGTAPFRTAEDSAAKAKAIRQQAIKAAMYESRVAAALPTSDDPLRQGVIDTTFSLGMMAPSFLAGVLTKNPALAASLMGSQSAVGSYGDARRAGADPTKAYRYGALMGTIEAGTEFLPMKFLIGDMTKQTGFVEAITKQLVADGVGEQAATVGQELVTWIELNPDKTLDEFVSELPAKLLRTAVSSAMTSVLLGGGSSALSGLGRKEPAAEVAPEGGDPAPEAAPAPETPAPEAPAAAAPEAAPDGEEGAPTPEQAELLDMVNKANDVIDVAAQAEAEKQTTPETMTPDQKLINDIESAFGMRRPPPPAEAPEERRARMDARMADERNQAAESTARVVDNVRAYAAAQQAATRAVDTQAPEDIVAAVQAQNEVAEAMEMEPVRLADEMDVDTTDRTSTLAESERMAAELEAMGTEESAAAASVFRTLIRYADKYDDNTFWQGFDEALENAAPYLTTEEQQQEILSKIEVAIADVPVTPEEAAGAAIIEEVRATAPASRYFGRKSFGGEGLATETPAAPAQNEAPADEPAPTRIKPKTPAVSEADLARIGEQETARARAVTRREDMALKAESVYDDVVTNKDVLEALDDEYNMSQAQIRQVMSAAIDGKGSMDRFNTLMKRYAKVRAQLDRSAASAPAPAAAPVAAPQPTQAAPSPAAQRAKPLVEGESWTSLWSRVRRFAGREDAALRLEDSMTDAAIALANMPERQAKELLDDARQLGAPAEKLAAEEIGRRVDVLRSQPKVMFSRNNDVYDDIENYKEEITNAMQELLPTVQRLEKAVAPITSGNQPNQAIVEPLTQVKQMLEKAAFAPDELPPAGVELNAAIEADLQAISSAIEEAINQAGGVPESLKAFYEAQVAENLQADITFFERMLAQAKQGSEPERVTRITNAIEEAPARIAKETLDRFASTFNAEDPIGNYGLDTSPENYSGLLEDWIPKARAIGLNDVADRLEAITVDQIKEAVSSPLDAGQDLVQVAAKVRRNIDELADEIFNQARAAEDTTTPEWTEILDSLRDMLETNEAEDGLRQYSRPRNVLFSRGARKPVKDPENNRRRLDATAWKVWGDQYLNLVQRGLVTYASAEEIQAMGLEGADGTENAITVFGDDGNPLNAETIINTSVVRPHEVEGILLHEVGVHLGLPGLLGAARTEQVLQTLDRLVDSFYAKMTAGQRPTRTERDAVSARLQAQRKASAPEYVREETLAYMVQDHVYNPFLPQFITDFKVALGRRFPGIIDRLGWGAREYQQLAAVAARRFALQGLKFRQQNAQPGNRSPRAPYLLEVQYPRDVKKKARGLGMTGLWRMIRTLDLRDVNGFAQNLKDMKDDLTSPEVFDAFFTLDPDFNWENYLDLMFLAQEGDADAAYDLTDLLTNLKGLNVPVDVRYSRRDQSPKHNDGTEIEFEQFGSLVEARSQYGSVKGHIRQNALIVSSSFVEADKRGKGFGTDLYETMAKEAESRGLVMLSDRNVTLSAAKAWRALTKRGWTVIENFVPGTDQVADGGASPMGMNPFVAIPPAYAGMDYADAISMMQPARMRDQFRNMREQVNEGAKVLGPPPPPIGSERLATMQPQQMSDEAVYDMANGGRVRTSSELRDIRVEAKKQQDDMSLINRAVRMFDDIETGDRDLISSTISEALKDLPMANELTSETYYPNSFTKLSLAVMYKAADQLGADFGPVAAQAVREYGGRFKGADRDFMVKSVEDFLRAYAGESSQAAPARQKVMFSRPRDEMGDDPPAPPVDPAIEEVYFNFVRFGDPDTVYPTIREALKSAGVKDRMGPPMTLRQVEIDGANTNAFEAMVKSRKGQALSREEMVALRNLHKYSALKVFELAQAASASPGNTAAEAAAMRAAMFHRAVLAEVKGQSAEASRTLSALRIQAKATAAIATAVDQMVNDAESSGAMRKMLKDIAGLDATQFKNLNKRVEMSTWKAWQELAGTWLRAMYLSMPSTHIVNALGNVTTMLGSVADHHVGGRLTMDPDLVEEAMVRFNGMVEGFVHQFEYMKANSQLNPLKPDPTLNFDKEGVAGADRWEGGDRALSADRLSKLTGGLVKASPEDPIGRLAEVIGYGLDIPSKALGTADDLFKGANYRMSMRGQAFRKAREERRAGTITEAQEAARAEELFQWPTEEMVKQGIFEAQENTFTRPVGEWTKMAMKARGGLNSATGVMGTILLPFIITPSNLMSFRFRRMPTAPLFEEWRSAYMKGGKDRAVAIAQVTNGTTLLMAGAALFGAGLLTGMGPDDPDKRKALMDTGWKPLALRLPNGFYMETNRLDPLMMPLHIAAAMAEVRANDGWNADPSDEEGELAMMAAVKFGQMMTDKTYLQGLSNIFEMLGSGQSAPNKFTNYVNRTVAGATTPALLAGVRRAEDPFKRQAFSMIDQMRNRTPVFSSTLPKAYDVFGRPVMYQEGWLSAAQLFNPFAVTKGGNEPIDAELQRLKYIPDPMPWTLDVPFAGNTIKVSVRERPDIYSEMTRLVGGDEALDIPNFRTILNDLVQSEGYQSLADINDPRIKGSKAEAIANQISEAREAARDVIVGDLFYPDLQSLAAKQMQSRVELAKLKEAEQQESEVTAAYEALLEEAK